MTLEFLDQQPERDALVLERVKRQIAYAAKQIMKTGIIGKISSQDYGVQKIAEQSFSLRPITACSDTPDCKVALARIAAEQCCKAREQRMKKRDSLRSAQRPHCIGKAGTKDERIHAAAKCLKQRSWTVCRQIQYWQVAKLPPPVREVISKRFAMMRFPLPATVVGILNIDSW